MKEKIIQLLKEKKEELPTTFISDELKEGYYKVLRTLEELEREGKVKHSGIYFRYWSLK